MQTCAERANPLYRAAVADDHCVGNVLAPAEALVTMRSLSEPHAEAQDDAPHSCDLDPQRCPVFGLRSDLHGDEIQAFPRVLLPYGQRWDCLMLN